MSRWRLALHALDRTGPPVLALALIEWMVSSRPDVDLDVVAFRGGDLLDRFVRLVPTRVLLDPSEPWDHRRPDPVRVGTVTARAESVPPADVTVLVSVSGGQVLPYLPDGEGAVVAWVVERGEDLHWVDGPLDLRRRVDAWLAGSEGSRSELADLGLSAELAPEFVPSVGSYAPEHVDRCRRSLGAEPGELLVVGAGIATMRKAPDLFVEVAAAARRRGSTGVRFVWIGGEREPLFDEVRREVARLGLEDSVRLVVSVPDIGPWLAAADVVLHPARLDAYPLVALHAADAATPVVGFSGAGGLEEMFGEAFVGAPFPDVEALTSALLAVSDPMTRSVAGAAQRDVVRARATSETAAPAVVAGIERAARRGSQP